MASKTATQSTQLTLDDARRPTGRGGWRPGAGRPRGRAKVAHRRRAPFAARYPLHVTLRVLAGLSSLRRPQVLRIVHDAIVAGGHRSEFRIVHFNVLTNHLHLIVEAGSVRALGRGVQGLKVRLARRLNPLLGRTGRLFADRYHARPLSTPVEVRNALRYVLLNHAHHERHGDRWFGVDPFSSGAWFDGWADERWQHEGWDTPRPTAEATTWLLATGWRRCGLIGFDETPGPDQSTSRSAGRGRATRR
jgi:REP element-mobilizing transposase RayT